MKYKSELGIIKKKQSSLNFYALLEEKIDFEGLSDYIRGNMIEDIKLRCFGNKRERGLARESLVSKARIYASAKTDISTKRTIKIVTDIADVLYQYYRSKVNRDLLFIANEFLMMLPLKRLIRNMKCLE
ncbi:hypothetical protein [Dorea amylophila]|uniref:hypothetical protein n=1 Tax=Dorea amylophila TaxID=2981789 RepID=UPI0022DF9D40|nr:hypothetical protein [Dorea amylophila]